MGDINSLFQAVSESSRISSDVFNATRMNLTDISLQQKLVTSLGGNTTAPSADPSLFIIGTHKMGSQYKVSK